MFCKNCGKESDGSKKFCVNCGNAFPVAQVQDTSTPPPVVRQPIPKKPWTKGRIIKTVALVAFVGGLILVKVIFAGINSVDSTAVSKNNSALDSFNSGDNNQAIIGFQQASKDATTSSNKMNSLKNLAYVYSSELKDDLALSTFQEALTFATRDTFDYYLISGEVALLQGKPSIALLNYNKAYQLEPSNFQVNNALNLLYLDIGGVAPEFVDYPKALTHALRAYSADSSSSVTNQNLGIAYFFNDKYDSAISYLSKSDLNKEPYIAVWLGLCYALKDDSVTAKRYFTIAINGGADIPQEVKDYMKNN